MKAACAWSPESVLRIQASWLLGSLLGRFKRLLEHEYAQHRAVIESAVHCLTDLRTRVQTGLKASLWSRADLSLCPTIPR